MATNKFLIFDENGSNLMSDSEYQAATQRISGVVPGLAEPKMHNKLYRQASIMASAIGRVLAQFGYDAPDDNLQVLANNIKSLFCFNVLDAYPVGSIYISASAVNPAQLFGGGTWERVEGKFLLAASDTYAAGTTGGEASHTLTTEEMPTHTHSVTVGTAGAHTHSGTTSSNGGHTHTRGTMNITGTAGCGYDARPYPTGAFYSIGTGTGIKDIDGDDVQYGFEAARSWTGETSNNGTHVHSYTTEEAGGHMHTGTAATAGSSNAHNNMPPYLSVYIWKRTA